MVLPMGMRRTSSSAICRVSNDSGRLGMDTMTVTPTVTITPTITPTPREMPYLITAEVFNSAGELVTLIATIAADGNMGKIDLTGLQGDCYNSSAGLLGIKINGVDTQYTSDGYTMLYWNAKNDAGQSVANGGYYIKITQVDPYGHYNTVYTKVNVLKADAFAVVTIYNNAGETVAKLKGAYSGDALGELQMPGTIQAGDDVIISYGTAGYVEWDTASMQGSVVAAGVYNAVLQVVFEDGESRVVDIENFTVTPSDMADSISDFRVIPNPVDVVSQGFRAEFMWISSGQGQAKIYIYNIAAELVRVIETRVETGTAQWDLKSTSGKPVSSGVYTAVMKAPEPSGGYTYIKTKAAVFGAVEEWW